MEYSNDKIYLNHILQIIETALDAIVTGPDFTAGSVSLLSKVAAVHVVYHQYQQEIMWFGQLTTYIPGILVKLDKTIGKYMIIM